MYLHRVFLAGALAFAVGASSASAAVSFTMDDYTVSAATSDPALVVQTAGLLDTTGGFDFMLNSVGDSITVDLFRIWTDEDSANFSDDFAQMPISVNFDFSAPLPQFSPSVGGTTAAGTILIASSGVLTWTDPIMVAFGNGGLLSISLSDEIFNVGGGLGLTPGYANGATVTAKFKLKAEPIPVDQQDIVPEPGALLVWGGLIGMGGLVAYRRRRIVA